MNSISTNTKTTYFLGPKSGAEDGDEKSLKRKKAEQACYDRFALSTSNSSEDKSKKLKKRKIGVLDRKEVAVVTPEKKGVNVREGTLTVFLYDSQGLEEEIVSGLPLTQSSYADDDVIALPPPQGGTLVRTSSIYEGKISHPPIPVEDENSSCQKQTTKRVYPRRIKRGGERFRPYRQSEMFLKQSLVNFSRSNPEMRKMWDHATLKPNRKLNQMIVYAISTLVDELRNLSEGVNREQISKLLDRVKASIKRCNNETNLTEEEALYAHGYNKIPKKRTLNKERVYRFKLLEDDQLKSFLNLIDPFFADGENLNHMVAIAEGKILANKSSDRRF